MPPRQKSPNDPCRRVYKNSECEECEIYRNLDVAHARYINQIHREFENAVEGPKICRKPIYEELSGPIFMSKFESDFEIVRDLGSGTFGSVFQVKNRTDFCNYADPYRENNALKEVRALAIVDHPGIVKYNHSWMEKDESTNGSILYIQMELCESTLEDWLATNRVRDIVRMKSWFHQIVSAVKYIHHIGKIHRDLKPTNILFANENHLKICDLGIVTNIASDNAREDDVVDPLGIERTFGMGTKMYMAPEQYGWSGYNQKVDIFALGLILVELCVFISKSEKEQAFAKIRNLEIAPMEIAVEEIVIWMTRENPNDRPECTDILEHPFLREVHSARNIDRSKEPPVQMFPKSYDRTEIERQFEDLKRWPSLSAFLLKFEAGKIIGDGASGCVFEARNLLDGSTSAIKMIPSPARNACKDLTGKRQGSASKLHVHDHDCVYIFIQMELCVCDLSEWLHLNKSRDLNQAKTWFKQIVAGVAYLHGQGKIHRDLKPSNLLLDKDGGVKIGDLGIMTEQHICRPGDGPDDIHEAKLRTTIGTPLYQPPEQAEEGSPYNFKVDIFNLVLIFIELCVKMSNKIRTEVFDTVRRGKTHALLEEIPGFSEFVLWLTSHDPAMRPTAKEILQHEFLLPYTIPQRFCGKFMSALDRHSVRKSLPISRQVLLMDCAAHSMTL